MESVQYRLCCRLLERLDREGVLAHVVLIGSEGASGVSIGCGQGKPATGVNATAFRSNPWKTPERPRSVSKAVAQRDSSMMLKALDISPAIGYSY